MQIDIKNRIVIITGPSTSGKTTLAKKIKEMSPVKTVIIAHDDIAAMIDQNKTEDEKNDDFWAMVIEKIGESLEDSENKLVVFDVLGIEDVYIYSLLQMIELVSSSYDEVTMIKMNLPVAKHLEFVKSRIDSDPNVKLYYRNLEEYWRAIMLQRSYYESSEGSLESDFFVCSEYVISDPKDVQIKFDLVKNKEKQKIKSLYC